MEVLKPFSDLLEINMKFVLYDLKYSSEDEKNVLRHNFTHRKKFLHFCVQNFVSFCSFGVASASYVRGMVVVVM